MSPVMTTRCHQQVGGYVQGSDWVCLRWVPGIPTPTGTDTQWWPPKHVRLASGQCVSYWNAFLFFAFQANLLGISIQFTESERFIDKNEHCICAGKSPAFQFFCNCQKYKYVKHSSFFIILVCLDEFNKIKLTKN